MRFHAAVLATTVLLCAGAARAAEQDVESLLVIALRLQFTQNVSTVGDDDSKVTTIRLNTKDFLSFVSGATGSEAARAMLRRTTTIADAVPDEAPVLSQPITVLDSDGVEIVTTGFVTQSALALTDMVGSSQLDQGVNTASAIKDDEATLYHVRRRDLLNEGSHWMLDGDGDGGGITDTDQVEIDLVGITTADSKRGRDLADASDAGLFLTSRHSKVLGGVHIDLGVAGVTVDVNGIVSGVVKATAEKIQ